ncbi:hypothetical protein HELRODRAFT_186205 [Helobdella robusta]|uniref:TLC domain-containing protein n=1 Tax=Helobdella robusta TaxID=6412 RepID=T1FNT3_HELRO|nr:hypothetical protein HELRODRAFT_186205 [Helobdella robusta]ESN90822.1 hypothetical protein HELRODRAFT_186205 [Helobdella robusta]
MAFSYYCLSLATCVSFLGFYKYISPLISSLYFPQYLNLPKPKQVEWCSRINSSLHAFLVSMFCLYCLIYEDEISRNPIWGESHMVRVSCAIVVGYMISDGIVILLHYKDIGEIFFLFHHVASIYAFCFAMTFGALLWFANVRLIAEFSTPFVNKRWFLDTLRYKKSSAAFLMNGFSMTVMFFSVRVISIPFYWVKVYSTYGSEQSHQLGNIWYVLISSCIILDTINLYWFHKILQGTLKLFRVGGPNNDQHAQHGGSHGNEGVVTKWRQMCGVVNGHVRSYSWSPTSFHMDKLMMMMSPSDASSGVHNRGRVINNNANNNNNESNSNDNDPRCFYNYKASGTKNTRPSIPAWPIQRTL